MSATGGEGRAPWWRYAWATILGVSFLSMTYVLFDPDLGTEAPLFQEFTCRGTIDVTLTSGFFEPYLRVPATGLYMRGRANGELVPSLVRIELREAGSEWRELTTFIAEKGEESYYVPVVQETTEARVRFKALDGSVCEGVSAVLVAQAGPYDDTPRAPPP